MLTELTSAEMNLSHDRMISETMSVPVELGKNSKKSSPAVSLVRERSSSISTSNSNYCSATTSAPESMTTPAEAQSQAQAHPISPGSGPSQPLHHHRQSLPLHEFDDPLYISMDDDDDDDDDDVSMAMPTISHGFSRLVNDQNLKRHVDVMPKVESNDDANDVKSRYGTSDDGDGDGGCDASIASVSSFHSVLHEHWDANIDTVTEEQQEQHEHEHEYEEHTKYNEELNPVEECDDHDENNDDDDVSMNGEDNGKEIHTRFSHVTSPQRNKRKQEKYPSDSEDQEKKPKCKLSALKALGLGLGLPELPDLSTSSNSVSASSSSSGPIILRIPSNLALNSLDEDEIMEEIHELPSSPMVIVPVRPTPLTFGTMPLGIRRTLSRTRMRMDMEKMGDDYQINYEHEEEEEKTEYPRDAIQLESLFSRLDATNKANGNNLRRRQPFPPRNPTLTPTAFSSIPHSFSENDKMNHLHRNTKFESTSSVPVYYKNNLPPTPLSTNFKTFSKKLSKNVHGMHMHGPQSPISISCRNLIRKTSNSKQGRAVRAAILNVRERASKRNINVDTDTSSDIGRTMRLRARTRAAILSQNEKMRGRIQRQRLRMNKFKSNIADRKRRRQEQRKSRIIVIPSNHPLKILWDTLTVMLTFVSAYVGHMSIRDRSTYEWNWFVLVTNIWFFVDLLLNFFTNHRTGDGKLLQSGRDVWGRYLTTWFVVDALSLLPWERMFLRPIIQKIKRRNFVTKWFVRSQATVKVSRILKGHHFKAFGKVAKESKKVGVGGKRLLHLIIKYVPKYLLFYRNMKGVLVLKTLRQIHFMKKIFRGLTFRNRQEIDDDHEKEDIKQDFKDMADFIKELDGLDSMDSLDSDDSLSISGIGSEDLYHDEHEEEHEYSDDDEHDDNIEDSSTYSISRSNSGDETSTYSSRSTDDYDSCTGDSFGDDLRLEHDGIHGMMRISNIKDLRRAQST